MNPPDVVFSLLSNIECLNSAQKFYIKLRPSDHTIHFKGIGLVFKHRPIVTIAAKPNGACLFNSMSLLLCGTDVYSEIIRHVICNYISEPQNYSKLQQHIPPQYLSSKDYYTCVWYQLQVPNLACEMASCLSIQVFWLLLDNCSQYH